MRFKNIITKKENIKYKSGDVLIVYNETLCEEEAYMVICMYDWYNILNLNNGETYYNEYEKYDHFVIKLESLFYSIERIDNKQLELVRVED